MILDEYKEKIDLINSKYLEIKESLWLKKKK